MSISLQILQLGLRISFILKRNLLHVLLVCVIFLGKEIIYMYTTYSLCAALKR